MRYRAARLAALAAGEELSKAERRRLEKACGASREMEQLAQDLRSLRERLMASREEASEGGSSARTIRALRERIASEEASHFVRARWGFVAAGFTLAALTVAAMLQWQAHERDTAIRPQPITARIATPDLRPFVAAPNPSKSIATSRTIASAIAVRPRGSRGFRGQAIASGADFFAAAMARVDEFHPQGDGTYQLRLRTENPNVVVYLIQGEPTNVEKGGM